MHAFRPMEWNALVNRARANLQAQSRCPGPGVPCTRCPMGRLDGAEANPPSEAPCRARFRATERQLGRLLLAAPARDRLQLRRTLDGLELTYRALWH